MEHIASVEPAADVLERARQALEYIRSLEADTILIVSHGTFGRALRHIINPEIPFRGSERFKNAEIVKLI
jgi:broad specificity phosphatase PhoE